MRAILPVAVLILSGCAETPVDPKEQAIEDYVEVGELEATDKLRMGNQDSWIAVTDRYVIYRARDGEYLLKFFRRCYELRDNSFITADERFDNYIRSKTDTLRGCRIEAIYPLTKAQADEIRDLPEAPLEGT